jgi:ATP-binding cassette subfamily B protein
MFSNFTSIIIEQGGTYIFLARKLFKGIIPISEFASVLNASLQFSRNFVDAINFLTRVKVNALYIDDFLWYMNYHPKLENKGTEKLKKELSTLDINELTFKYPSNEVYNLDNVNLKIYHGQRIAIVGLNGAGKTTLIKLLLKFYEPESGSIYYNNENYSNLDEKEIRNEFSIIFQDFQTYALSIAENILMREVKSFDDEELVWEALEKVGLKEKVESLPDTIYTLVTREFDDNGVVFSGGERQKLVIARVFASNSEFYVLDEPTASLDPIAEKTINDLIIRNATNKTIIIIAHRLSTVVDVDHIILIEQGKIIEAGTHKELIDLKGKYYNMFETQASLYKKV